MTDFGDPKAGIPENGIDPEKRKDIHLAFYKEYVGPAAMRVPGLAGNVVRYTIALGQALKNWKQGGVKDFVRKALLPAAAITAGVIFFPYIMIGLGMASIGAGFHTLHKIDELAAQMMDHDILKGNLQERYKNEIADPRTDKMLRENSAKLKERGFLVDDFDGAAKRLEPPVGVAPAPASKKNEPVIYPLV